MYMDCVLRIMDRFKYVGVYDDGRANYSKKGEKLFSVNSITV